MNDTQHPAQPGYWAILPAGIRYDDRIPANAKILYAEISALTGLTGYCFAPDSYFAELYQMTERTIRSLLKALEECGYIRIEREAGEHNRTAERRIYAGLNPLAGAPASLEKNFQTESAVWKKFSGSLEKIFQTEAPTLYKNINNKSNTRVCGARKHAPREAPEWKPERFAAFWSYYRKIPGEGGRNRNENKQAAMDAWDNLRPDDALIDSIAKALLRQRETPEWARGVGIPMASTYLNQRRWEDAEELGEETDGDGGRSLDYARDDRGGARDTEVKMPWI